MYNQLYHTPLGKLCNMIFLMFLNLECVEDELPKYTEITKNDEVW